MTFKRFVADQCARMTSFDNFAKLPEAGRKEIVDWIFARAAEPDARLDRTEMDWLYHSTPAKKVKGLVDECLEFEAGPGIHEIKQVWNRLNPPANVAREECSRCNGTGWIEVQGPFGMSAAYPCSHQPETEGDRRMGLKIAPSMVSHYVREASDSEIRKEAWGKDPNNSMNRGLKRVTSEDIARLAR